MSDLEILQFLLAGCQKFRIEGKHRGCWILLKGSFELLGINIQSLKIPKGTSDVMRGIIYKFLEEFTIFSFYTNQKDLGLQVSDKLLFSYESNIRGINKSQLTRNQQFYMGALARKNRIKIAFECDPCFSEMNPSIISIRGGYLMNLRTSNFGVKPGGVYYCKSPEGIVDTKNYILELTPDFQIKSKTPVIDESGVTQHLVRGIKGLEDLIIFQHNGDLWGSCTCVDTDPHGIPQIGLCKLDREENRYVIRVKRPVSLLDPRRPEKNWLPFSHEDQIKFIYGYSPTQIRAPVGTIAEICKGSGFINSELKVSQDTELCFDRFRGSAGPMLIEIDEDKRGYLIVVHEVIFIENSRVYTHRFVLVDSQFKIIKMSNPWFLEALQIEFIRGGCIKGNEIILTAGIKDNEAWIYVLDKRSIMGSLINMKDYML